MLAKLGRNCNFDVDKLNIGVYIVHSLMPEFTGFWHLACYLLPVLLDIIGREGNLENMGCFTLRKI